MGSHSGLVRSPRKRVGPHGSPGFDSQTYRVQSPCKMGLGRFESVTLIVPRRCYESAGLAGPGKKMRPRLNALRLVYELPASWHASALRECASDLASNGRVKASA